MKEKITRQSILLFEKQGFSDTSIQDIVEALGVTKGTFYYYFTSKEQLLMIIHLGYIDDLLVRQELILKNDSSCREKLEGIVSFLIDDIEDHGSSGKVFFREMRHLADQNAGEVKDKREKFRFNIEKVIRLGMEQGEFREDLQADMISLAVLGVTNWSYQWFNPKGEISAKRLAKIYNDLILKGII